MELQRVAAASTFVTFPMLSTAGVPLTGLSVTGHWVAWADTVGPTAAGNPGFQVLTGAIPEIGQSGVYANALASTELPAASPWVMLRYAASGAATQYLLVRTATFFAHTSVVGTGAITSGTFAAGAIDASAIAADAGAEIADAVWDEVITSGHTIDNTSGKMAMRLYHATDYLNSPIGSIPTAAENSTQIWHELMIDAGSSAWETEDNTAGKALARLYFATDYLNAKLTTVGSTYADDILGRTLTRGASGGRTVGQALMALRNKVSIAAGTLTVTSNNDTTTEWTATIATEAVTAIVTSIDPA